MLKISSGNSQLTKFLSRCYFELKLFFDDVEAAAQLPQLNKLRPWPLRLLRHSSLKQRQRRLRNGLRKRALQTQAPPPLARKRPSEAARLLSRPAAFLLESLRLLSSSLDASLCSAFCIDKAYILVFKTSGSRSSAKKGFLYHKYHKSKFIWTFLNC